MIRPGPATSAAHDGCWWPVPAPTPCWKMGCYRISRWLRSDHNTHHSSQHRPGRDRRDTKNCVNVRGMMEACCGRQHCVAEVFSRSNRPSIPRSNWSMRRASGRRMTPTGCRLCGWTDRTARNLMRVAEWVKSENTAAAGSFHNRVSLRPVVADAPRDGTCPFAARREGCFRWNYEAVPLSSSMTGDGYVNGVTLHGDCGHHHNRRLCGSSGRYPRRPAYFARLARFLCALASGAGLGGGGGIGRQRRMFHLMRRQGCCGEVGEPVQKWCRR